MLQTIRRYCYKTMRIATIRHYILLSITLDTSRHPLFLLLLPHPFFRQRLSRVTIPNTSSNRHIPRSLYAIHQNIHLSKDSPSLAGPPIPSHPIPTCPSLSHSYLHLAFASTLPTTPTTILAIPTFNTFTSTKVPPASKL